MGSRMEAVRSPGRQGWQSLRGDLVLIVVGMVALAGCHRTEVGRAIGFPRPPSPVTDRDLGDGRQFQPIEVPDGQQLRLPPSTPSGSR
jgi:hypothetical protein